MKKLSVMLAVTLALLTACVQNPYSEPEVTSFSAETQTFATAIATEASVTTVPQTALTATETPESTAITASETAVTTTAETTEAVTTTVTTVTTAPDTEVTTTLDYTLIDEDENITVATENTESHEPPVTTAEPIVIPPWWATGTRATEYENEPFMKLWLDKTEYTQRFDNIVVNYETTMDGPVHLDFFVEKWTDEKWDDSGYRYVIPNGSYGLAPPKGSEKLPYVDFYPRLTPGKYRIRAEICTYEKLEDFVDDGSEYRVNADGIRWNSYYAEFEITE